MTIGDKIKKIRTFRNMTQAELGKRYQGKVRGRRSKGYPEVIKAYCTDLYLDMSAFQNPQYCENRLWVLFFFYTVISKQLFVMSFTLYSFYICKYFQKYNNMVAYFEKIVYIS